MQVKSFFVRKRYNLKNKNNISKFFRTDEKSRELEEKDFFKQKIYQFTFRKVRVLSFLRTKNKNFLQKKTKFQSLFNKQWNFTIFLQDRLITPLTFAVCRWKNWQANVYLRFKVTSARLTKEYKKALNSKTC